MIDRFHHLFITPADFDASLAFYKEVLGWSVTDTWGGPGAGRGVALTGGGIKVVIAEKTSVGPTDEGLGAGRPNVHLDIHDIDKRFAKMAKGAHVVREPEDTHWNTRWFVVKDPDGNLIAFEEVHGG